MLELNKEKLMCKVCWSSVVVLLIALSGMTYKFVFQGVTEKAADGRQSIPMNEDERDLVLSEMRLMLESVQLVTSGLTANNMELVAVSARKAGIAAQQGVPGSLMGKLPMGFKKLGRDTHARFDELALDAEQLEDSDHTLSQLSELMQNCVACHAIYRIDANLN